MSKANGKPTAKRMVSKAEYRRHLRKRYEVLTVWGFTLGCLAVGSYIGLSDKAGTAIILCAIIAGASVFGGMLLEIQQLEPVEPISRHNVDRLSPADALVRASDAPRIPETTLLRAATTTETPQEQLLMTSE